MAHYAYLINEEWQTRKLGAQFAESLKAGDIVYITGELGAGKTTFVRGILKRLGHEGPVRSPTFNLMQVFDTSPPVLHVDLYRVKSYQGLGLEDYVDTHLCLIEWAKDRTEGFVNDSMVWKVHIDFQPEGRLVSISPPERLNWEGADTD